MEGLQVASNGLGPLPRRSGGALARGCGGRGRVVLPLARAAAVSTGWSVRVRRIDARCLCVVATGDGVVRQWYPQAG